MILSDKNRAAFSLIEVNMALLVVTIGLAALLGLFPVGLRESSLASADTTEAIFATRVLNAIQANASDIKTWSEWTSDAALLRNIEIDGEAVKAGGTQLLENYGGVEGSVIRYQLSIGDIESTSGRDDAGAVVNVGSTGGRVRYASIRVSDNRHSQISNNTVYYTEFRYRSY